MGLPIHIEITMNSRVDLANLIHAASDEICRLAGFDEDACLNLGLALREATVNAVKHGNQMVLERPVRVLFDIDDESLEVTIQDKGKGFNFRRAADPRLPENIEKTNGRGLFLMRNFADEVTFEHEEGVGTTVRLIKKLPKAAAKRVGRR